MTRNQIITNLLCGASICFFAAYGVANDECVEGSLKTVDRIKLRLKTGTPFSAQEIECRKVEGIKTKQVMQDNRYFATRLSDYSFRDHSNSNQNLIIDLDVEHTPEVLTISISSTQKDGPEKRSLDTLRGFKSVKGEQ